MRRAAIGFATVFVAGLLGVAALGFGLGSSLAYSLGVNPAIVAVDLAPGDRACQAPIRPPTGTEFDHVGVFVATSGRPGPKLGVAVLNDSSGRRLASGTLPGGYSVADGNLREQIVRTGRIASQAPLRICVENEGRRPTAVVGQDGVASPSSVATLDGEPLATDLSINLREDRQSLLARLPEMAERAGRFRAGWVAPPVYLGLAALLVVGAPLVLARGLGRLSED